MVILRHVQPKVNI